jgi:rRNA maturation endonuclease Nob1
VSPLVLAIVSPLGIGAIVFFVILAIVLAILQSRCPKCGKVFGAKLMSRTRGAGPRSWIDHNKCKGCGHEWDRHYTKSQTKRRQH